MYSDGFWIRAGNLIRCDTDQVAFAISVEQRKSGESIELMVTMLSVQAALRMLHVSGPSLVDDPYSTERCQEGSRNGAERVEEAAVGDPASQIEDNSNDSSLDGEDTHHEGRRSDQNR